MTIDEVTKILVTKLLQFRCLAKVYTVQMHSGTAEDKTKSERRSHQKTFYCAHAWFGRLACQLVRGCNVTQRPRSIV